MTKVKYLILQLIFISNLCNAQSFQNLNLNNGLSQPSVLSICQDALGRMWFGTREGINIYDGNKIKSFKGNISNGNNDSLWIGNSIYYIVSGQNTDWNKMYFMSDFFLYSYDVENEKFCRIDNEGNVTAIIYYNDKLIFAQDNNIFSYDSKENKKSIYKILPKDTHVNSILIKDDYMYLGTVNGVIISPLNAIWDEINLLDGEDIYRIYKDSRNVLWIGTRMNGLYRIVDNKIEKVPECPNGINGIIDPQIREFAEDNNGNIWFGTFMGLQMYDVKKKMYTTITIPQYVGGLNHPSIFSLYKENQGTIWAGSYYGGVNYFNPTKRGIVHYDYQVKEESDIFYSYIAEMVVDKRGSLWVSTDGGGISCLNSNWETIKQFTSNNRISPNSIPHNNIKSLCYDDENDALYIGTHMGGLSRYDIKNNRFYNYLIEYKSSGTIPGNIIHHIEKWKEHIIISCRKGVFSLNTKNNKFTKLPGFLGESPFFDIDNNGVIYSSTGKRLIITKLDDFSQKEVVVLDTKGEVSNILAKEGKVYICTLGSGLIVYDTNSKTQTIYNSLNSNLPSNYCYSSKLTSNGKLILTGDKGITMFDLINNTFSSIKQNYLKAPIINGCGICISEDDNIYIGDVKGITKIGESDFTSMSNNIQPVYLSNLSINNNRIIPSESDGILTKSLTFTEEVYLKHNENNITIEFASSDYTNENIQQLFEYKLEGLDKTWNTTTIPIARYTNLSPGKYRLYVRTQNNSTSYAQLGIIIVTPWYNTWWAWILYIIVITTITEVIIRYRSEKKNLALSLEKEKFEKQNIEKLNHEKLVFFTNVSHEFRTPLTLIISHIDSLMQMPSLEPLAYNKIMKLRQNAQYMSYNKKTEYG